MLRCSRTSSRYCGCWLIGGEVVVLGAGLALAGPRHRHPIGTRIKGQEQEQEQEQEQSQVGVWPGCARPVPDEMDAVGIRLCVDRQSGIGFGVVWAQIRNRIWP